MLLFWGVSFLKVVEIVEEMINLIYHIEGVFIGK